MIGSTDCKHFDLKCPEFPTAAEIKEELEETSGVFSLFDEFHRGLHDMSQQEWIIFRSKYYQLEEYLAQWYEKLKAQEQSAITDKLKKEIDKFKVICCKLCSGTMYRLHIKIFTAHFSIEHLSYVIVSFKRRLYTLAYIEHDSF